MLIRILIGFATVTIVAGLNLNPDLSGIMASIQAASPDLPDLVPLYEPLPDDMADSGTAAP